MLPGPSESHLAFKYSTRGISMKSTFARNVIFESPEAGTLKKYDQGRNNHFAIHTHPDGTKHRLLPEQYKTLTGLLDKISKVEKPAEALENFVFQLKAFSPYEPITSTPPQPEIRGRTAQHTGHSSWVTIGEVLAHKGQRFPRLVPA